MKLRKQNVPVQEGNGPGRASAVPLNEDRTAEAAELIRSAHRVLVHYLPGASLPQELFKVRAMLDAQMFGRDKRMQRDDVVRVARQIDSWHASKSGK